jgi:hypothetical protein
MFDVMLEIAAHPLGAFKEKYKNAFQCLEVDGNPPACWPLLDEVEIISLSFFFLFLKHIYIGASFLNNVSQFFTQHPMTYLTII